MKCYTPAGEITRFLINDCACTGTIARQASSAKREDDCACIPDIAHPVSGITCQASGWRLTTDIICSHLIGDQFLLANPGGNGIIALVNQEELSLLTGFKTPPSLDDCAPIPFPAEQAQTLTRQWIRSGLLAPTEDDCACASTDKACQPSEPVLTTITSWLHLTDRCNLRCDYCYLPHIREDMSVETGKAAIDATFKSAIASNFLQVKLKYAGGEPLLRFPMLVELHRYAQSLAEQNNLELDGVVLSNGTLLTPDIIETMHSLGLRLMISLDGLRQYHDCHRSYASGRGSSADVLEAVEMAQSGGLTPNISITISGRNIDGLPGVIGWALEHDLPFSLNFYRENDFSASNTDMELEEQKIITGMRAAFKVVEADLPPRSLLAALTDRANLSTPHQRTCGVGQNYLVFDTHGRVAKCQMQMDKLVSIGEGQDALTALHADSAGIQNLTVEEKEGCQNCQWRYWCAGGCPLATHRATGRYDVKSPNCNIYQAIFPDVLRLEGLRLLKYQDDPEIVQKIVL